MRINETYGYEPILSRQPASACPMETCEKIGTQCVDISAAVTLTPAVTVGTVSVSCQGDPDVTCETNKDGTSCTVTLVQRVCVSVPVSYGVTMTTGETTIACGDGCCQDGCQSC